MDRIYEGRVFSVEIGQPTFPNGSSHHVEIVRHRPSVVLLPCSMMDERAARQDSAGRVLAAMLWELPAGSVDVDEPIEAAARRECAEEIDLVPAVVERLAALYPAPGFCDELLVFFRVSGLQPAGPDSPYHADEDEFIEVRVWYRGGSSGDGGGGRYRRLEDSLWPVAGLTEAIIPEPGRRTLPPPSPREWTPCRRPGGRSRRRA